MVTTAPANGCRKMPVAGSSRLSVQSSFVVAVKVMPKVLARAARSEQISRPARSGTGSADAHGVGERAGTPGMVFGLQFPSPPLQRKHGRIAGRPAGELREETTSPRP
jgi:hypothetical protein